MSERDDLITQVRELHRRQSEAHRNVISYVTDQFRSRGAAGRAHEVLDHGGFSTPPDELSFDPEDYTEQGLRRVVTTMQEGWEQRRAQLTEAASRFVRSGHATQGVLDHLTSMTDLSGSAVQTTAAPVRRTVTVTGRAEWTTTEPVTSDGIRDAVIDCLTGLAGTQLSASSTIDVTVR